MLISSNKGSKKVKAQLAVKVICYNKYFTMITTFFLRRPHLAFLRTSRMADTSTMARWPISSSTFTLCNKYEWNGTRGCASWPQQSILLQCNDTGANYRTNSRTDVRVGGVNLSFARHSKDTSVLPRYKRLSKNSFIALWVFLKYNNSRKSLHRQKGAAGRLTIQQEKVLSLMFNRSLYN